MSDTVLVRNLAETLISLPYETWNFGDSIAFEALLEASEHLGDERWASFTHGWARAWATRATPYRRLDCTAPGLVMVRLARRYADERLLEATVGLAEYLMARPTLHGIYETWEHSPLMEPYGPGSLSADDAALLDSPPAGCFIDCLHFDPPFFAALAAVTGEGRYSRAALEQAVGYVEQLQTAGGLFDHFILRDRDGASYGAGWGRGQGWALLGLLDTLDELGDAPTNLIAGHEGELARLHQAVTSLVEAQVALQRPDGHWYAVVTDPRSGDEFSTAAFMAAGFWRALRCGYVEGQHIENSAERALYAVRAGLGDDDSLRQVSVAVMASTESSHYVHVPRDVTVPWGQGPALVALTEGIRSG